MRVRDPRPPGDHEPPEGGGAGPPAPSRPGSVSFSVPLAVIVAKVAGAAVLALLALVASGRADTVIAVGAALLLAGVAARDLLARERLRADAAGLVAVRGYAGHRHLDWSQVEQLVVRSQLRFGARTEQLEVDAGEEIFLFSRFDLGVDPRAALAALTELQPRG